MSVSMETKKQARVRFAESDTGDLIDSHGDSATKKPYAPLPELTIPTPGAAGGSAGGTAGAQRPAHLSPTPKALASPVRKPTPTVTFEVPGDRDYLPLLHQTKMVYDQLLCDKQAKLLSGVYSVKQQYDEQCRQMERTCRQRALEYGVRAQAHLHELQTQADSELTALHTDYQMKMDKMRNSLDEKWRQDNPDKAVQYKLYVHK